MSHHIPCQPAHIIWLYSHPDHFETKGVENLFLGNVVAPPQHYATVIQTTAIEVESYTNSKILTVSQYFRIHPLFCNKKLYVLCIRIVSSHGSRPSKYAIDFDERMYPPQPTVFANLLLCFNPLNAELNPICYLLALLAHHFLHVSRIRVKSLTLRLLMSYIYGAPILDVSRSYTTTQQSR